MASDIELQFGQLQAIESLRWWIRVGVTYVLDAMPHDRLARSPGQDGGEHSARNASESTPPFSHTLSETTSHALQDARQREIPETAETSARALARAATDLEMLRSKMEEFDGCALKRTATQLVFADGLPGSRIMLIGEAPGEGEDRIGRPFVGRAGQLLDRMLSAIGLDREKVYVANVVPWRPPGNRTPTLQETQICLPFIERQIDLADPEYLVCLGGSAARALLGVHGGIMRARGSWLPYPRQTGRDIRALAMLHPAFLLRQPAHKRFAWMDMRALARALETRSR
ncbi:MAG TPA: uracil-DNA glycosylase [Steroidobacteraceae bacterium]